MYLRAFKPATYELMQLLSFDNMYESWWFMALLGLFTLNLICCTINRFPSFWRFFTQKEKALDDQLIKTLPLKKTFRLKAFDESTRNSNQPRSLQKHLFTNQPLFNPHLKISISLLNQASTREPPLLYNPSGHCFHHYPEVCWETFGLPGLHASSGGKDK